MSMSNMMLSSPFPVTIALLFSLLISISNFCDALYSRCASSCNPVHLSKLGLCHLQAVGPQLILTSSRFSIAIILLRERFSKVGDRM